MKNVSFRYLSQEDILSLRLSTKQIVDAVERVILSHGRGLVQLPPKPAIFPREGKYSYFHAMPAYVKDLDICGLKWLGRVTENPEVNDLPQFTGLQVVNDPETGVPLAVMDCRWITVARTTALSVITARCCAPEGAKAMAIIGAGLQGRFHGLMFEECFPGIGTIFISSRSPEGIERYRRDMEPRLRSRLVTAAPEEAVRRADIVVSAGVRTPTFRLDWIRPGALCIGLDLARAWCPDVIDGVDRIFIDDAKQFWNRYETEPEAFGHAKPPVTGEISHVLLGKIPGRESRQERILSLNVGMAICDLALGDLIYREAERQDVGVVLPLMEREDLLPELS